MAYEITHITYISDPHEIVIEGIMFRKYGVTGISPIPHFTW